MTEKVSEKKPVRFYEGTYVIDLAREIYTRAAVAKLNGFSYKDLPQEAMILARAFYRKLENEEEIEFIRYTPISLNLSREEAVKLREVLVGLSSTDYGPVEKDIVGKLQREIQYAPKEKDATQTTPGS